MSGIARFVFFNFFLLTIPIFLHAQDVKFYAESETLEVPADGYFEIYFRIENGNGVDLTPPSFSDFTVLGPPSFSSETSIINGNASRSSNYTFTLEPRRPGRFTIGAATVKVNGKIYTSKPINIEVVKEKSNADLNQEIRNGGDVFARIELSSNVAYPGQQITLEYKVYSKIDISSQSFNSESKFTGIYVKPFKNYDGGVKIKTINGEKYMVRTIRKLALFPQQTGTLVIDPAVMTVGIPMDNEDPFGSLFSSSKPKQLRTNSAEIEVRPLPAPIPKGFLGAVGEFQYSVTTDKNELTTDDAAMLNFKISGNGDMKKIQTPSLAADSLIDYYPAEVLEDQEQEISGEWTGTKSYVIDLTPKKEGQFNIEIPPFVYFDPKIKEYKTISPESLPFSVTKGLYKPGEEDEEGEMIKEVSYFQKNKYLVIGASGCLILLAFVGFVFRPSKRKSAEIETPKEGIVNLAEISKQPQLVVDEPINIDDLLKEAELLKENEKWKEFYQNLNVTLGKFLSDKFEIPFSQFSTNSVVEHLEANQFSQEIINEVKMLMQGLESAVYARFINQDMASDMMENVKNVIRKLN